MASARRDYGAVIDESILKIDREATQVIRKKLKAERKRDNIFIDQRTKPFARREFRLVRMDEEAE